jgi:hypothetical protein
VRYLDTSSLVALYYPEAKTVRLEAHLRRRALPIPFTWLRELEFTNSLKLALKDRSHPFWSVDRALMRSFQGFNPKQFPR